MAQSKAHIKAANKYNAKAYDRIALLVKKGERDKIKAHAVSKGLSLNAYINALIKSDMDKKD
ncbi:MAG: antitoxin [Ruminococcus sp.]|nr:antitoxin [Ruminococcus sp.]